MDWRDALDIVVERTKHQRFRWMCSDDNPNDNHRIKCRERMIAEATGAAQSYPSPLELAGNVAGAIGRAVSAVMHGQPVLVTPEAKAARLAICEACPEFDPAQRRCRAAGCGCFVDVKSGFATEACPIGKWPAVSPT